MQRISAAEAAITKGAEGVLYQDKDDPSILYTRGASGFLAANSFRGVATPFSSNLASSILADTDGSGASISASAVDGATPWTRLYGPNEIRQSPWAGSAELTTPSAAVTYVTAAGASSGPVMFRREGAALWINGATLLANSGAPTFGTWRTTSAGLAAGALASKTIALLVYAHRRGPTTIVKLRIGKNTSNYVTYQWPANTPMLVEGWNVLLCHTSEPIGTNGGTGYQMDFQSAGSTLRHGQRVLARSHSRRTPSITSRSRSTT